LNTKKLPSTAKKSFAITLIKRLVLFSMLLFVFSSNSVEATTILDLVYVKGTDEPDTRGGIYMDGTYVWIADHHDGLWWANMCYPLDNPGPPSVPAVIGQTTGSDTKLWDLWHDGGYIYGGGESALYIYQDKDGAAPGAVVGSIATQDKAYGVYATGG